MAHDRLKKTIINFLRQSDRLSTPFLLGLSGGPDSLALFFSLLDCQKELMFKFAAAHVDHGWRAESAEEARLLEEIVSACSVPFHKKTLDPKELKGNLEAASRNERLLFFQALCQERGYGAVMLGHHRDDQAETVLKRVFEGGVLSSLGGLKEINHIEGLEIWRPLLDIPKAEINQWIAERSLNPFVDRTNLDARFLRGRFRTQIFPELSTAFGKEIAPSLCRIGEEAHELTDYLESQTAVYFSQLIRSDAGVCLDLNSNFPRHCVELKFLIKKICEEEGCPLSYDLLDTACRLLQTNMANKQIPAGNKKIYIDRRRFFIQHAPYLPIPSPLLLQAGEYVYGPWNIKVKTASSNASLSHTGWKKAWAGKLRISLPQSEKYFIGPPSTQARYGKTAILDRWWSNHKVPAFLRYKIPVIWHDQSVYYEFLSGHLPAETSKPLMDIEIELKKDLCHIKK